MKYKCVYENYITVCIMLHKNGEKFENVTVDIHG